MNRAQEQAYELLRSEAAGHGHSIEPFTSPVRRGARCSCGWVSSYRRQGRNALATASLVQGDVREHLQRELGKRA